MIELYTAATSNGFKISIMLEETGIPYNLNKINLSKQEQKEPWFLKINPNGRIPAIVDTDGLNGKQVSIFESGAILMYLAEKSGKFLPKDKEQYYEVMQWLMFQMGGIGPMTGQAFFFTHYAPEKIPYAIDRYMNETKRLVSVLDNHLVDKNYLAKEYSIADISTYPWLLKANDMKDGTLIKEFKNVQKYIQRVSERPAVIKGMGIPPKN